MGQDSSHNRPKTHESGEHDTGQSLGSYIQRERLKKQITIEQVAEDTCIHIGTLRAIENNDRSKMPAEVFSRGFIKLYAEYLGLDPQEILERYIREMSVSDEDGIHTHDIFHNEKLAESSSFFSARKIIFFLFLAGLVGLGYYFFFYGSAIAPYRSMLNEPVESELAEEEQIPQPPSSSDKPKDTEGSLSPVTTDTKVGADAVIPGQSSPQDGQNPPADTEPTTDASLPQNEIVPPSTTPVTQDRPEQPPASSTTRDNAAPLAVQAKLNLHIVFSERTWMQATVDDQTSRNYLFDPGEENRWSAEKQIKLFIGNSGGVKIFVNDRELSVSGKSGTPLRLTIPDDMPPE